METTEKISIETQLVQEWEAQFPVTGGSFFEQIRKEAIKRFETLGVPDRKNEDWKYTNIRRVFNQGLTTKANETSLTNDQLSKYQIPNMDANLLVIANGKVDWENSKLEGVEVSDLTEAYTANQDLFNKNFTKVAPTESNAMVALNTAFFSGVHIHFGGVNEKPLYIIHWMNAGAKTLVNSRTLISVAKSGLGEVIETFVTGGNAEGTVYNYVSEAVLAENASLHITKVQNETGGVHWLDNTSASVERYAVFNTNTLTLNTDFTRNDLNVSLDAENCEAHLYGVYLGDDKQHIDNHSRIDHRFSNCQSNEHYKGVIGGKATAVFNGKVHVHRDAQKTNAFQENNNILLTDDATINSKPELEIYADDVKCSHGSTTGQLDEDALFYLRARGLSREGATTLLLNAFAEEVLDNIKNEELNNYLKGLVEARLGNLQ